MLAIVALLAAIAARGGSDLLHYDPSAYETAPEFVGARPLWSDADLDAELMRRISIEKSRRELDVYYYRIGYRLAFDLPITHRPQLSELPVAIPGMKYPWLIWLSWDLEERWRLLHRAWRIFGDQQAGRILQTELAALDQWDSFQEVTSSTHLVTAHLAAALAVALPDGTTTHTSDWDAKLLQSARSAANVLIERDIWPWYEKTWANAKLTPATLGNINVIILARGAQLARVIGSPRRDALETRAREVLLSWRRLRVSENHTEGSAYDGYMLDSVTEWLDAMPDREQLMAETRDAFANQAQQWIQLTVPGRADLQVPLGDVEPEMTHWVTALVRITRWYKSSDAAWLLRRILLSRMRVAALVAARDGQLFDVKTEEPKSGIFELPNSVAMRMGWSEGDLLAVAGLSRGTPGHLQADAGQVIIAWRGRCWITDPGYQQYRPGIERDYTLNTLAHNAPVINGTTETLKRPRIIEGPEKRDGKYHVRLDLTDCYKRLPKSARVCRDVWLQTTNQAVAVRDTFTSLTESAVIQTSWLGGTNLAWGFRDGQAKLSDGTHAIWIASSPGELNPANLTRHEGTRGPLALTSECVLPDADGEQWWFFSTGKLPAGFLMEKANLVAPR